MTLDRLVFAAGDRLLARDLADVQRREAALHAIHVRAVHRTWGVALGYALAASADREAVLVGPGLAYDPCGRALVLARAERVPLPDTAPDGTHVLAAVARDEGGGPRWTWLGGAPARAAVPVAHVTVAGGLVTGTPQPGDRPVASAPPHIAGGRVTVQPDVSPFVTVRVDTSHAGFVDTPCYFAQAVAGTTPEPGAFEPVLAIHDERPHGFKLDVRRLGPRVGVGAPVVVAWLGVEVHMTRSAT